MFGGVASSSTTPNTWPTCVAVTAAWCTYCTQELAALEALKQEYGAYVRIIAISLDHDVKDLRTYLAAHAGQDWTWYFGGDDPAVMDVTLEVGPAPT